jgi:serine/threonine protein kinase
MLASGTRFGPYEITSLLGAGGMGEVYRAKDLRLKRDVALKILPPSLASDPGRLARFQREAEVLAALDHPHIGAIYGSEVSNDLIALVLQLVEGETLADRIARGPLPVDEALQIARQIAEALAAAHAQGVIHRDLKPANISITSNNAVKVLDFGLAKLTDAPAAGAAGSSLSPTMTSPAIVTGTEVLLGTAAYMSPEQARGKAVDKRADVWAFGCVLYEMLTGERLHQGETVSETVAAVLKESPDLTRVPARLRRVLRSCLQKDPERRLRDVADWQLLIDDDDVVRDRPSPNRRWLWPVAAGVLLIAAVALGVVALRQPEAIPERSEAQIPQPPGLTFVPGTQAAMSPDGRWLAFPSIGPDNMSRMYIRSVSSLEVQPLSGSEGISNNSPPPFWSYDSRHVIYNAGGRLKKNETTGTPAQSIGDIGFTAVQGGTANAEGMLIYGGANRGLQQIPLAGGKPAPVTVLAAGETAHRFPQFLPDGRRFLYLRVGLPETTGVYLGSLDVVPDKQDMTMILPTNRQAWWVMSERTGSAFLLMQREETLLAQPIDLTTAKLSGTPTPVANGVGSFAAATAGLWSVSRNGALTYRAGGSGMPLFTWRGFKGEVLGTVGEPGQLGPFNLSRDGSRVAYRLTDIRGNQDIYVHALKSNISSKFAFSTDIEDNPVWSSDGKKIFFAALRNNSRDLYEKNADGTGEERLLLKSDAPKTPLSASDDGRFLLFLSGGPGNADLYLLSLGDGKAFPFVNKNEPELSGQISPGSKWISYNVVGASGPELFVRPFPRLPPGDAKPDGSFWAVATGVAAGQPARWTPDGRRLMFLTQTGDIMAVDLEDGPAFKVTGPAQPVVRGLAPAAWTLDAKSPRILTQQLPSNSGPPPPFTLLLNWLPQLEH